LRRDVFQFYLHHFPCRKNNRIFNAARISTLLKFSIFLNFNIANLKPLDIVSKTFQLHLN